MTSTVLLVGCYAVSQPHAKAKGKGICSFKLEHVDDKLRLTPSAPPIDVGTNPTFFAATKDGQFVVAALENCYSDGKVVLMKASGNLKYQIIGFYDSGGVGACYASFDRSEKFVFIANYHAGSAIVYRLNRSSGKLEDSQFIQYTAHSNVIKDRQEGPHAHCFLTEPSNRFAYMVDLGADRIYKYNLDESKGLLRDTEVTFDTGPGSGPRHIIFSQNGKFAYANMELSNDLLVFDVSQADGSLALLQTITLLPNNGHKINGSSHIAMTTDGKYLYVSNRGFAKDGDPLFDDTIAMFAINQTSGKVELLGHQSTFGKIPRDFIIEPTNKFLIAANQDSDTLVVYKINEDGRLSPTDTKITCYTPCGLCIVNYPAYQEA